MIGLVSHKKRKRYKSSLSLHERALRKGHVSTHRESDHLQTGILNFPTSRLEEISFCCLTYPLCCILLPSSEQMRTGVSAAEVILAPLFRELR